MDPGLGGLRGGGLVGREKSVRSRKALSIESKWGTAFLRYPPHPLISRCLKTMAKEPRKRNREMKPPAY